MSNTPTLKVFRDAGARPLERGTPHSAGLDIGALLDPDTGHNDYEVILPPGARLAVPTGIYVSIPEGHYGRVAPRSGLAFKHGIDVLAGVIDSDYTGEVKVILLNTGANPVTISNQERIAQLIIEKISMPEVEEVLGKCDLGSTVRGDGGFGSTG